VLEQRRGRLVHPVAGFAAGQQLLAHRKRPAGRRAERFRPAVFAAIFAVAVGGETLGAAAVAGGVLVVTAMYLVQVRSSREPR
jgi:hypothetical protein